MDIPVGGGKHITFSLNVGPMVLLSPGLAAGGALRQLFDDRIKAQARLDAEAAKKGVPAGKIRPLAVGDLLGVASQAAWSSLTTGRTVSGLLGGFSEFGTPNATKSVASVLSAATPTIPFWQELSRMMGVNLDAKLASVWDYMLPMPTSGAAKVNLLGDKVGSASDLQTVVQVLTGGNYPIPVSATERKSEIGYRTLFETGYRPPSIDPNKGYTIDGEFRPMIDNELVKYTNLRGQYLKEELSALGPTDDPKVAQVAYRRANVRALQAVGAFTPSRQPAEARNVAPAPAGVAALGRIEAARPAVRRFRARRLPARRRLFGRGRIGFGRRFRTGRRPSLRVGRGLRLPRRRSVRLRRY